ncbi:MAG: hypothetical protein ACLP5E_28890 [Streptosporangiaceae bacterium]
MCTAIVVCAFAGLWFALPLSRRDHDDHQDDQDHGGWPRPSRPTP